MSYETKYQITERYLSKPSKRRSGTLMPGPVKFIVVHDTGNPKSTAANNVAYYERSRNEESASAHIFVDDKEIIECIPALTAPPEKAWHVLYSVSTDNQLFGCDANDAAIGIEYCFGGNINPDQAYDRYLWTIVYACRKFNLDPRTKIVGHFVLDPERKTDPNTGLNASRRTYDRLLADVVAEFQAATAPLPEIATPNPPFTVRSTVRLNLRRGAPSTRAPVATTVASGTELQVAKVDHRGDPVNGLTLWYADAGNNYFWSGGVVVI